MSLISSVWTPMMTLSIGEGVTTIEDKILQMITFRKINSIIRLNGSILVTRSTANLLIKNRLEFKKIIKFLPKSSIKKTLMTKSRSFRIELG
jgi:hypothetical protein